jgi:hypothetical protein
MCAMGEENQRSVASVSGTLNHREATEFLRLLLRYSLVQNSMK